MVSHFLWETWEQLLDAYVSQRDMLFIHVQRVIVFYDSALDFLLGAFLKKY